MAVLNTTSPTQMSECGPLPEGRPPFDRGAPAYPNDQPQNVVPSSSINLACLIYLIVLSLISAQHNL